MKNNLVIFVKSHVDAFTRKDGVMVQAHDTKVQAKVPPVASVRRAKGADDHPDTAGAVAAHRESITKYDEAVSAHRDHINSTILPDFDYKQNKSKWKGQDSFSEKDENSPKTLAWKHKITTLTHEDDGRKVHVVTRAKKGGGYEVSMHTREAPRKAEPAAPHDMGSFDTDWDETVRDHGSAQKAAYAHGWGHVNSDAKGYQPGPEPTSGQLGNLKDHYEAGKKAAAEQVEERGDADSGMHSAFDDHIDNYTPSKATPAQTKS